MLALSLVLLLLVPSHTPRPSSHPKYVLVINMFFCLGGQFYERKCFSGSMSSNYSVMIII